MTGDAVTSDNVSGGVESRTLRSSVAILDDALDRVSALDFKIPNPFVNHAPMAVEALAALGLDSLIDDWVEGYEPFIGKAVPPIAPCWGSDFDWRDFLGDYRRISEWMGYFGQAIDG